MPGSAPGGKPVRFAYQVSTVAGDAIVRDKVTGLVWQLDVPAKEYTWEEAKLYCDELSLARDASWG